MNATNDGGYHLRKINGLSGQECIFYVGGPLAFAHASAKLQIRNEKSIRAGEGPSYLERQGIKAQGLE